MTDSAHNVNPESDIVTLDGIPLVINPEKRYYFLNKPTGAIVSMSDIYWRSTVVDLLGEETKRAFPVGRLDANTSGLLLPTDDGDLIYRLIHPSFGVDKVCRAEVAGKVKKYDIRT